MITKTRITMPSKQIKMIAHTSILGVEVAVSILVVVYILDVVVAVCIVGGVVVGHVIESFLSPGY